MTTFRGMKLRGRSFWRMAPNAAVNLTTSTGVRDVPGAPPTVPLIPEILLINDTINNSKVNDLAWSIEQQK